MYCIYLSDPRPYNECKKSQIHGSICQHTAESFCSKSKVKKLTILPFVITAD